MQTHGTVDVSMMAHSIRRDGWVPPAGPKLPPAPAIAPMFKIDKVEVLRASIKRGFEQMLGRADANETAMFLRQLLYIMPQPYDAKYPEIRYQNIVPVSYSVPTGARTHAFHQFDEFGTAEIVDDYADDAPSVERNGVEVIGKIYPIRDAYSYSIQDIRSAMMAGLPLEAMKAITARRVMERKCDKLACVGDTSRSMYGLANDPNIIQVTATTKAAGGLKWGSLSGSNITYNATPEEILKDIGRLYSAIKIVSKGVHEPNTLVLGTQNMAVINTLRLDQFNMVTVARYLLQALPWLQAIEYWPRLDTAGAGNAERVLLREANRENFECIVPQEFEQFPPQPVNLSFRIECHKRWGEPQMRYPKHCAYMDGTV